MSLRRNLSELGDTVFDLVIIGGGIVGACIAWDAALRGMSVALVEKGDFGGATSAASGKLIHGGLRYLQHGELHHVRESLRERAIWCRLAPHLIHPVSFLIPTYGYAMRGLPILRAGMTVYELLGAGIDNTVSLDKRLPHHQVLSHHEALSVEPGLDREGLTGGVLYHELQMHSSERLTLSFILSAARAGVQLANYLEVTALLHQGLRVTGVRARDLIGGGEVEIRGRMIVNCAGPWADRLLNTLDNGQREQQIDLAKGVHLVTRPATQSGAVALATKHKYSDALVSRGGRHFFIVPWRGHSLIGTTNVPYRGQPNELRVTEQDIGDFLEEINEAYPGAQLHRDDVAYAYAGLYRIAGKAAEGRTTITREYQIYDHAAIEGFEGIITVIGVKYTTSRNLARKAVDLIVARLGKRARCRTERVPLYGGQIDNFDTFVAAEQRKRPYGLSPDLVRHLVLNYGAAYPDVLHYLEAHPSLAARLTPTRRVIAAEVLHAVRHEMALRLSDVVFRRTGLGTLGNPGDSCLQACATIMAAELGWDATRVQAELDAVRNEFVVEGAALPQAEPELVLV